MPPYNGSGSFVPFTPGNPVISGTPISSSAFNNTINDIATGLTNTLTKDGQSAATANIPMASHKLTGLSAGTLAGDSVSFGQTPSFSGLDFSGTGGRITGNFSDSLVYNRVVFKTSVANGITGVYAIPDGTGQQSGWIAAGMATAVPFDQANCSSFALLLAATGEASLRSQIIGTGTYLPMTFYTSGSERMRIDTSGNVIVATGNLTLTAGAFSGAGTNLTGTAAGLTVGTASTATTDSQHFGVGQTWQSVTRVSGTTYTNSTGKPIMVRCFSAVSGAINLSITVSGTTVGITSLSTIAGAQASCDAIVPNGATYVLNNHTTAIELR